MSVLSSQCSERTYTVEHMSTHIDQAPALQHADHCCLILKVLTAEPHLERMPSPAAQAEASVPMVPTPPQVEVDLAATDNDQPTAPPQQSGGGSEAAEAADTMQSSEADIAGKGEDAEWRPSGRSDSTSTAGMHIHYKRLVYPTPHVHLKPVVVLARGDAGRPWAMGR